MWMPNGDRTAARENPLEHLVAAAAAVAARLSSSFFSLVVVDTQIMIALWPFAIHFDLRPFAVTSPLRVKLLIIQGRSDVETQWNMMRIIGFDLNHKINPLF